MQNRIVTYLNKLKNRKLLIPFFTAGFPSLIYTQEYIKAAESAGADFIEIGIPFSDPLADGPEIQFSSKAALDNNLKLKDIFGMVEKIRKYSDIPLLFMNYVNQVIAVGEEKFLKQASGIGIDGLIIPDLPVEESVSMRKIADKVGLSMTFLVSPTSSKKRIKMIDKNTTGFVYAVTVAGVTGANKKFSKATDSYLHKLHNELNHKFVAGFGVSNSEDAKRLTKYSDGVVIGSKLIQLMKEAKTDKSSVLKIERFLKEIRKTLS